MDYFVGQRKAAINSEAGHLDRIITDWDFSVPSNRRELPLTAKVGEPEVIHSI